MASQGFGKNSGPCFPPRTQTLFGNFPPTNSSTATPPPPQPQSPPPPQLLQPLPPQLLQPLPQPQRQTTLKSHFENGTSQAAKRTHSPGLEFEGDHIADKFRARQVEAQRSDASPGRLGDQKVSPMSPLNQANSAAHRRSATAASYAHDTGSLTPLKPADYNATKRTRSPPIPSSDEVVPATLSLAGVDAEGEREMRAKAKRQARFSVELSQPLQSLHDSKLLKASNVKHSQPQVDNKKFSDTGSRKDNREFPNGTALSDYESQDSSTVIVGLCQDMCPESEREERERKGDLDQYERLDGERNQSSKSLAVKKYNRMAEREALLIRPMPVLQKTVDYLLQLMDQLYNNKFLGMYNFLWDRMRAIRMDLRMQHIFNQHAIVMLEQMIRLHIIAMHELCEYKKGEGFSDGFDAHLNIEQMNKTSVELFQMYDDHRKRGISVLTEREFRGYYALLKLDKHPGYKVEPAELSLDLAKMTPEIRGSPEVLFARDVARACRTGNFIAFFRLARQATYLQACLMHAHFSKLRTQALASLHSGLQNNQGIPVALVVKWLGMQGEDVENLLEYHGFIIKTFEETYMVKEGPFLNSDVDYPTKCSKLVHLKKSRRIIDDVSSSQAISGSSGRRITESNLQDKLAHQATEVPAVSDMRNELVQRTTEVPFFSDMRNKFSPRKREIFAASDVIEMFGNRTIDIPSGEAWVNVCDEEMPDFEDNSTPKAIRSPRRIIEKSSTSNHYTENEYGSLRVNYIDVSAESGSYLLVNETPSDDNQVVATDGSINKSRVPLTSVEGTILQEQKPAKSKSNIITEDPVSPKSADDLQESEAEILAIRQKHEAASEKLKMIIRIWKQQATKKREIREQRQLLSNLALSSVSLGPPVRQNEIQPSHAGGKLDIDFVMRERDDKRGKSWSRLNVSSVVGPILNTRNPKSNCICWKLLICIPVSDSKDKSNQLASTWLLSKLRSTRKKNDDELVVSSSNVSIWKSLVEGHAAAPQLFCFSIVREVLFGTNGVDALELDHATVGVNAIVYLISERISWESQKSHLHDLLKSIPPRSRLPLLILSSDACKEGISDPQLVVYRLGLQNADNTRVSTISVVFLAGDGPEEQFGGFLSDDNLREGFQWLANQSPLQPCLNMVKTRDLVLSHLAPSLDVLNDKKTSDVDPDHCISIFNNALDRSAEQVQYAAYMNPNCWPCPELGLLEEYNAEKRILDKFLPDTGWSSAARIQPIIAAIHECKLPSFSRNLSWLSQGSYMGKEIADQKSSLEDCLINYLTQSSDTVSGDLATKEAHLMIQTGAALVLHDSYYYIIPKWLMVFQRIYNWRLMRLACKDLAVAYVLDNDAPSMDKACYPSDSTMKANALWRSLLYEKSNLGVEWQSVLTEPTLDEMVEVGCSFPSEQHPKSAEFSERTPDNDVAFSDFDADPTWRDECSALDSPSPGNQVKFLSEEQNKESIQMNSGRGSDKLDMLLEQCNMFQNMIDEKLSIYF